MIYVSLFFPFFPNIVTSYLLFFFKVRVQVRTISRALAPSQSLTPQRLHPKFGTAVPRLLMSCFLPSCVVKHQGGRARGVSDVVTLVAIARAPPPLLSLRHTSGWRSERGVRAMIVTHAVVARAPPLVTSRERRCAFIVTWDFWDFVYNNIFLI